MLSGSCDRGDREMSLVLPTLFTVLRAKEAHVARRKLRPVRPRERRLVLGVENAELDAQAKRSVPEGQRAVALEES